MFFSISKIIGFIIFLVSVLSVSRVLHAANIDKDIQETVQFTNASKHKTDLPIFETALELDDNDSRPKISSHSEKNDFEKLESPEASLNRTEILESGEKTTEDPGVTSDVEDPNIETEDILAEVRDDEWEQEIYAFADVHNFLGKYKEKIVSRLYDEYDGLMEKINLTSYFDRTDLEDGYVTDEMKALAVCWNLGYQIESAFGKINYEYYRQKEERDEAKKSKTIAGGTYTPKKYRILDFNSADSTFTKHLDTQDSGTNIQQKTSLKNGADSQKISEETSESEDTNTSADPLEWNTQVQNDTINRKLALRRFIYKLMWCDLRLERANDDDFLQFNKKRKYQSEFLRTKLKNLLIEEKINGGHFVHGFTGKGRPKKSKRTQHK